MAITFLVSESLCMECIYSSGRIRIFRRNPFWLKQADRGCGAATVTFDHRKVKTDSMVEQYSASRGLGPNEASRVSFESNMVLAHGASFTRKVTSLFFCRTQDNVNLGPALVPM